MSPHDELPKTLRSSWRLFLESYEPLRPELYRYCRHLTRSPWDAEDLAQDTLARAFVTLGRTDEVPPNPRAWLFRVASNLWIDRVRAHVHTDPLAPAGERSEYGIAASAQPHGDGHTPRASAVDPRATREAAGTLLGQLAPRERAAVVLKDVFDLSLEETAEALTTTVGAVKSALHRAREKLAPELTGVSAEVEADAEASTPRPEVLDAFCAAFNAGDIDRLTALLLDTSTVEVVGATVQYGPEAARRTVLWGMLFGVTRMVRAKTDGNLERRFFHDVLETPPRVEARQHRGAWILVHWYAHESGDAVRAFTTLECRDGGVARLRNFFYDPDLVAEVCAELGLPSRSNGYHWWPPTKTP